jgi:hypothetical protein
MSSRIVSSLETARSRTDQQLSPTLIDHLTGLGSTVVIGGIAGLTQTMLAEAGRGWPRLEKWSFDLGIRPRNRSEVLTVAAVANW